MRGFKSHLPHKLNISGFELMIMNWKEFVKPTIAKLLLFIIFVLIIPFPWLSIKFQGCVPWCWKTLENGSVINSTQCPCASPLGGWSPPFGPIVSIFYDSNVSSESLITTIMEFPVLFIILFILSYLFSCFVIWIYHKVKKK